MKTENTEKSHILLTLSVLFMLGGAMRLLPGGTASAETDVPLLTDADFEAGLPIALGAEGASGTSDNENGAVEICLSEPLAAAIQEDHERLDQELEALRDEKLAMEARRQELEALAAQLSSVERSLDERWRQLQIEANRDLEHLSKMYASMKPDQAAAIFDQMDPAFAAGFLRLIPSEQAGLILASMDMKKAYVVSVRLASLNQDVREAASR